MPKIFKLIFHDNFKLNIWISLLKYFKLREVQMYVENKKNSQFCLLELYIS